VNVVTRLLPLTQALGDGPYPALGVGLKRWHVPVRQNGRWRNAILQADLGVWVRHINLAAIAARTAELEQLLGLPTPEERRAGIAAVSESLTTAYSTLYPKL